MTVVALLLATCVIAIQIAIGFDGKCGGWLPALSGARPCTVWEYVWSNLSFTWLVILHEYWMIVLAAAGVVFTGSVLFERFRR
jgi:hypothetical protein